MTFLLTLFGTEVAKMNKNLLYFLVFICNIVVMRGKKVEIEKNETTFVSLTQAVVAVPAGAQGPEGPSRGGGEDD